MKEASYRYFDNNFVVVFKLKLDEEYAKELEYEFHSANYHMLIEVVTGLKIAAEYLIKVSVY